MEKVVISTNPAKDTKSLKMPAVSTNLRAIIFNSNDCKIRPG